jgi:Tol biopolymer transport system component
LYNFVENQNSTVYDDGHLNRCPIIESDGKGLLLSTSEGGTTGIYSIGLSEKKKEKILETHGYHHFEPSISPDGTKIIFSSTLDGDFDLWIYHLKEKELEQITRDKGFEGRPCWLSNYKVIYEANHPDHWGIWSIDLRTKEKSLITPKGEKCRYPTIVF